MSGSIGIIDNWCHTLAEASEEQEPSVTTPNLQTLAQPDFQLLGTAAEFVRVLKSLSVAGPLNLTNHLMPHLFIGEGGQFSVFRSNITARNDTALWKIGAPVAVKKCKIVMETNQVIDLTGEGTRKQVHAMLLEVLVLRHTKLRSHRNIVRLLGWAKEGGFDGMPLLVMELATEGDLMGFLNGPRGDSWNLKHHLCLDMAAGLDAIHDVGIIHADFKPENILVFPNASDDVPLIAKLSDFGYSSTEANTHSESKIYITALTKGWQAPEIILTTPPISITTDSYKKADNYSLGLVVWSVCCFRGQAPPACQDDTALSTALEALERLSTLSGMLEETFSAALEQLLQYHPTQRTKQENQEAGTFSSETPGVTQIKEDTHPLRMDPIQQYFWAGINKSFEAFGSRMTGGELFSLFLENTWGDIHAGTITLDSYSIQQLLLSAERGFVPAQAVVDRVFQSYEIDWPSDKIVHRASWLFEGAAIGCPLAYNDLYASDQTAAKRARTQFYQRGGYQQYYYSDETTSLWRTWRYESFRPGTSLGIEKDDDKISETSHPLQFFDPTHDHPLNKHELLYLSCLAGDSRAVIELCKAGANTSIIGEPGGATCLHWLLTFPDEDMEDIASLLMQSGNINAELGVKVPVAKDTFPFAWPPGTPLHWAVASSSSRAVNILLKNGADCCYRNGIDPYMYDMDVRYFERDGEDESQGMYSAPTGKCLGMSPVDLAVCSRDVLVLSEFLALQGRPNLQIFEADEEGYTPFHRLEYNHIGRTANQHRFASAAFDGSRTARRGSTSKVISILKQLGGNIDQLTNASPHNERRNDRPGSLTPLMLAVRWIDLDTVTALLENAANVNVRNELGFNVLSQLPESGDYNYCFRDLPSIVGTLLKHDVEVAAKGAFRDYTPLANAILCGSIDVMELLLAAGADPTEKSKKFNVMAWWVNHTPLWGYMLPWTRKMSWRQRGLRMAKILTQYVFSRDTDDVRQVLHHVDAFGSGLLHYAVASGHPEVVKAVLAAGGDKEAHRTVLASPIDRSLNSASWVNKMGTGTALEVCSRMKDVCIQMSTKGHEAVSPAEYKFMVKVYDEIKEILVGDSR
ncbi:uncharacterized protein LY89DRAFT_719163 [Mollisia scopiformis]|uniref:Protein kinase domain-containing protein n=1 Tax=Mollisia scopiformis TaxID=149040 RepID=A0A194X8F1_MOLSC|nr:uncharacterized protein LY89DRAFT_719163 [Mollisia scopiformis]KUJ16446.1 hypothetical protein LY89DRAFT_719163 [Mollisia scopiformis]